MHACRSRQLTSRRPVAKIETISGWVLMMLIRFLGVDDVRSICPAGFASEFANSV